MRRKPRYRRSGDGKTIHKPGCRWYARSVAWPPYDGASEADVRTIAAAWPWLRLCKVCWDPEWPPP